MTETDVVALVSLWLIVGVIAFVGGVGERTYGDARVGARLILCAPIWPLVVAVMVVWFFVWLLSRTPELTKDALPDRSERRNAELWTEGAEHPHREDDLR